jgi:5'-nucleotidase
MGDEHMTWMQTYHTRKLDFADPMVAEIDIRDIALALARAPRYVGHTHHTYCVAEHSFWVARLVERWSSLPQRKDPQKGYARRALVLAALLHDASEAYTGDISRPLKQAMRLEMRTVDEPDAPSSFDMIEARLQTAILVRFAPLVGVTADELVALHDSAIVKDADRMMLAAEQKRIVPVGPHKWKSTEDINADEVLSDHRILSADWPQMLRFPVYGVADLWSDVFMLEFARIVGSAS